VTVGTFDIEDTVSEYRIGFGADSPYRGLEVTVTGMTIGQYRTMMRGWAQAVGSKTDEERAEANIASSEYIQDQFFAHVRSWNLSRKGKAVPVSRDELDELDSRLSAVLVRRWMDELVNVPDELLGKSGSGGTSEDLSLALASSSAVLEN
jgi:hypothetical protein